MKKQKLIADWRRREKVIADTESSLADLLGDLKADIGHPQRPLTELLAVSVSARLCKFQSELCREFEAIRLHRRVSESMLRALHLKNLQNSYVSRLDSYVGEIRSRLRLKQKDADKIIGGVMAAVGVFTKAEKAENELQQRIPMARSRAEAHIKREIRDHGEFPVFQTKPKRKHT
jgi:hypothetical protein